MLYQYGQNFSWQDNGKRFTIHPGEWLTIRLPFGDWKPEELPSGFLLCDTVQEDFPLGENQPEQRWVVSIHIDDAADVGTKEIAFRSSKLSWLAQFDVLPG